MHGSLLKPNKMSQKDFEISKYKKISENLSCTIFRFTYNLNSQMEFNDWLWRFVMWWWWIWLEKYYRDNSFILPLSLNTTADTIRIKMDEEKFNLLAIHRFHITILHNHSFYFHLRVKFWLFILWVKRKIGKHKLNSEIS